MSLLSIMGYNMVIIIDMYLFIIFQVSLTDNSNVRVNTRNYTCPDSDMLCILIPTINIPTEKWNYG